MGIDKTAIEEYRICHEKDKSHYIITLYTDINLLKIYDLELNEIQNIFLDEIYGTLVFEDVNFDGYLDIVVNTGGTINETHDLYIWDSSSYNFNKVVYEGFETLVWFTPHEDYIENFIRGDKPESSIKQKLI